MHSTMNGIFHFSYFDPDNPTSGLTVIGLPRPRCAETWAAAVHWKCVAQGEDAHFRWGNSFAKRLRRKIEKDIGRFKILV
jgi:hypothetical protein